MLKKETMRVILIFLFLIKILFAVDVLILNSYSVQFPWTKGEVEGILKNLKNRHLKIYIEFMDTKIFKPTPLYLKNYYTYLKTKYKNIPLDIVITTDDNALNFVIRHKKDLFKNAKVFFAGVNNLKMASILNKNYYTGVFEKKEPLSNLLFAKKTVANLKYVYIVSDNSVSGKSVIKEYKNAFRNIKKYKFIYINTSDLKSVLKLIKNSPENSAMLLLTPFSFIYQNHHIDYKKAIHLISNCFKRPIIIHTDMLSSIKNSDIIGGRVTDAFSQGKEVSKKVLEYINGEKIKNIAFTYEKANKMYLNVKNLEKFGIDAYSLGYKNAVFVNKNKSVFEKYKYLILSVIILFFIMLSLIVVLYLKNKKLREYSKNSMLNADDEIKKLLFMKENMTKTKIEALKKYMIYILNILKRDIYETMYKYSEKEAKSLSASIDMLQNTLISGNIKDIKKFLMQIKTFNEFENILISGENTCVKIEPVAMFEVICFLSAKCKEIKINFLQKEIKVILNGCVLKEEELENMLEMSGFNFNTKKNGKNFIVTIKN